MGIDDKKPGSQCNAPERGTSETRDLDSRDTYARS